MSFLAKVSDNFEKSMKAMQDEISLTSKNWKTEIQLKDDQFKIYYSGEAIFSGVISYFKKISNKDILLRLPLFGLLAGPCPIYVRLILGMKMTNPDSTYDTVFFYLNFLMNLKLFMMTSIFFMMAKKDVRRIAFMMDQLSHLISMERQSSEIVKVLPTINFLEDVSLNSWKMMRRISIDYGKKYFYRHSVYLPVIFLKAICCLITTIILDYGRISMPEYFSIRLVELELMLAVYSFVFFVLTFDLLWTFSGIKESFEKHTLRLHNVRAVLEDFKRNKEQFFGKYLSNSRLSMTKKSAISQVVCGEVKSHVHSRLAREISLQLGEQLDTGLTEYIDKALSSVTTIIEELGIDQKYQSIEIMGFVITKNFTGNLIFVLISLIFGFLQFILPSGGC